jgi:membrane protease YdiL (CAAX protease family)
MSGPAPPPAPPGARIHGRDLLLVTAISFGLFWLTSAIILELASGGLAPSARANYLIAFYAAWTFALLGAVWFVILRRRGMRLADLGYAPPTAIWAVRGVGFGMAALPAVFVLSALLRSILGTQNLTDLRGLFGGDAFTVVHAVTVMLYAGFLVPFAEELLFRGLLFRWLRQRLDFWPAALISATLFGIAHQRLDQMIIVGLLGLPLAWLTEKSRSLVPAILMHQTYNSLTLLVTFAAVWFQPESSA